MWTLVLPGTAHNLVFSSWKECLHQITVWCEYFRSSVLSLIIRRQCLTFQSVDMIMFVSLPLLLAILLWRLCCLLEAQSMEWARKFKLYPGFCCLSHTLMISFQLKSVNLPLTLYYQNWGSCFFYTTHQIHFHGCQAWESCNLHQVSHQLPAHP